MSTVDFTTFVARSGNYGSSVCGTCASVRPFLPFPSVCVSFLRHFAFPLISLSHSLSSPLVFLFVFFVFFVFLVSFPRKSPKSQKFSFLPNPKMAKKVNSFSDLFQAGPSENPIFEVLAEIIPPSMLDRKSTRLNSSHSDRSRMPSSA